jgi:sulfide:quinone oxidoreductase
VGSFFPEPSKADTMAGSSHHQVVIVGGGSAGITVAAILKRRAPGVDVALIEPGRDHYYQPAFTLVGAGAYPLARTHRTVESLIPFGVRLIRAAAQAYEPQTNMVRLNNGDTMTYDYLVVCTGVALDWGKVAGLIETLGKNGVCSNYSPAHVTYTWDCLQKLKSGGRAVFTQPPLPFKCPGAPQKIAYLVADHLQRQGIENCSLNYYVHAPVIFGVPFFARQLVKVAARYGINVHYQHNLVAVDGPAKTATFENVGEQKKGELVTVPFDMLHVSPPQSPSAEIRSSPLVNAGGWVEVNQNSMQHVRYPNVFSLGDVCSTPNSKTAAAVRKQAPVVVRNILSMMGKTAVEGGYDGYASCPLTTAVGKAILAEFIYGGKVTPTLPLNPAKEHWIGWWIKVTGLPILYWQYMLKGYVWFPKHNTAFKGDVA